MTINSNLQNYYEENCDKLLLSHELLSLEEEKTLAERASNGELEAVNSLVRHSQRFLRSRVIEFHKKCPSLSIDDLHEAGNLGLIEAAKKFKPEKGTRFSTYAAIRVHEYLSDYAEKELLHLQKGALSLDLTLETPDGEEGAPLVDLFCQYEEDFDKGLQTQELERILLELPQREREILCCHFGVLGQKKMTLQEIGDKYNLSRERIRQIEASALKLCKEKLTKPANKNL